MRDDIIQIDYPRDNWVKQHWQDAKSAEDFPDGDLHAVSMSPVMMTVEGTPEAIRWLYDYLHHLKRAWRQEGEQWDAKTAEQMAERIYDNVDELPERQRSKQMV